MLKSIDIYIGIIIMMCGIVGFARIILNEPIKTSKFKLILVILVSSIIYTLTYLYLTPTIKTLINCILQTITFKYLFKIDNAKSVLLTFLYVISLTIPDAMILLFFTKVLNISKEVCYEVYAGGMISNGLICVLFIIQTFILKKYLRKIINYKLENNTKIILYSILTFICIAVVFL